MGFTIQRDVHGCHLNVVYLHPVEVPRTPSDGRHHADHHHAILILLYAVLLQVGQQSPSGSHTQVRVRLQ